MTHQAPGDKIGHPEEKLPEALGPWIKTGWQPTKIWGNSRLKSHSSDENMQIVENLIGLSRLSHHRDWGLWYSLWQDFLVFGKAANPTVAESFQWRGVSWRDSGGPIGMFRGLAYPDMLEKGGPKNSDVQSLKVSVSLQRFCWKELTLMLAPKTEIRWDTLRWRSAISIVIEMDWTELFMKVGLLEASSLCLCSEMIVLACNCQDLSEHSNALHAGQY